MKLLTFRKDGQFSVEGNPAGQAGVLLRTGDILDLSSGYSSISLARSIPASVRGIIEVGEEGLDIVRRLARQIEEASDRQLESLREQRVLLPVATTPLLAPIPDPALIVAAVGNYGSHQKEMDSRKRPTPESFIKGTTALTGHGCPIVVPPQFPDMIDYEGELVLVFGRACHNVGPEDAMEYVAGYTIVNDVSARNWVEAAKSKDPVEAVRGWVFNMMGKQLPTFCPMGPVLVTRDEVADPHNLTLTTTLNGNVMQSVNTGELSAKLPELISSFSKWYLFRPGDLIMTGTPSGVGFARSPQVFMKAGDVVSIQIEGIGTLSNPVE